MIRADFDRFADPLVYTPGDNEWTDCHRANNGGYNPLERLAEDPLAVLLPPRHDAGPAGPVASQADRGFPENVALRPRRAVLRDAARGGQQQRPRARGPGSARPPTRRRSPRSSPDGGGPIANVRTAFAQARRRHLPGVVLHAAGRHVRPDRHRPGAGRLRGVPAAGAGARRGVPPVPRPGVPLQRRQPPLQPGPPARVRLAVAGVLRRAALGGQPASGSPSTARTWARRTGSR